MRLLIGILITCALGIWALGTFIDSVSQSVNQSGRNWPITRGR